MDFDERLEKAVHRGRQRGDAKARHAQARALTEEELKRLHGDYRLQVSEHIEACMKRLPNHFPGFQYEPIYGERGWGAACRRDDVNLGASSGRQNLYSRLEISVPPYSNLQVIELNARGTIRNKEVFNRKHFEKLADADPDAFLEMIDLWVLEYAELFAAQG